MALNSGILKLNPWLALPALDVGVVRYKATSFKERCFMKQLLVIFFVAVLIAPGYAQKDENIYENPERKARVEDLLSTAERYRLLPLKLNSTILQLGTELSGGGVSVETRRVMTIRLVKIYRTLGDSMTSHANKERIIEVIGGDNSPEAHGFYLEVIGGDNVEYRDEALRGINPAGIHGNDLYEKIKELETAKAFPKAKALMYLKLANPERALKEINDFLKTTRDLNEFVHVSINLSMFYTDPAALDVVFDRYPDFRGRQDGKQPSSAVELRALRKYLKSVEGERFKKAMAVFEDQDILDKSDRALLFSRLKSKDVETRRAITEYLVKQSNRPTMPAQDLRAVFEESHARETDYKIKKRLEEGLDKLRRRGGKK